MRRTFAHEAVLDMEPDADTRADRAAGEVHVKTLFAVEPELENVVRQRALRRPTAWAGRRDDDLAAPRQPRR